MGRQHFAVGIDIDAGSLGLFQQLLQIGQVVAGNQDRRIAAHAEVDFSDLRMAVFRSIGLVQQRHRRHTELAGLQGQRDQVLGGQPII